MMYNHLFCIFLLCIGVILIRNGSQANPGVAVKATTRGLNAVKDLVTDYLETNLINTEAGFSGSWSKRIWFTTITIPYSGKFRITNINIGSPVVRVSPPNIFTVSTTGASMSLTGSATASRYTASLSPNVNGVSMRLAIAVGQDSRGKPTFTPTSCQIPSGSLNLNFHGFLSILNRFSGSIQGYVFRKACKQVENLIKEKAQKITSSLNPDFPLFKDFSFEFGNIKSIKNLNLNLDLAMNRAMYFTTTSVTAYGVGSVYCPSTNPRKVFNFGAPPLPGLSITNRMVLCSLSQYFANTMSYTFWSKDVFTLSFSLQQIIDASGMNEETMTSTLLQSPDEATVFLQLFLSEPERTFIDVRQSRAPLVSFLPEGFLLNTETGINIASPLINISLSVILNVTGKAYFESDCLKINISSINAAFVSDNPLIQQLLTEANNASPIFMPVILSALNSFLEDIEFKIPVIYGFKLSNLAIIYKANAAEISTDFRYVG